MAYHPNRSYHNQDMITPIRVSELEEIKSARTRAENSEKMYLDLAGRRYVENERLRDELVETTKKLAAQSAVNNAQAQEIIAQNAKYHRLLLVNQACVMENIRLVGSAPPYRTTDYSFRPVLYVERRAIDTRHGHDDGCFTRKGGGACVIRGAERRKKTS